MQQTIQRVFAEPKKAWASFVSSAVAWLAIVGVFDVTAGTLNVDALSSLTLSEIVSGLVLLAGNGAVYMARNATPTSSENQS